MSLVFLPTESGMVFFCDEPRACPVCHTAHLWMKRTLMQETMCLDCYHKGATHETQ
jgi:hypothetical protein